MTTEAVIVIPGIMGSELKDSGKLIWPGSPSELVLPYKHMASLLKPDLEVGDVIRSVSISEQYASLIRALETCGFIETGAAPTLKVFPYDWRKDNSLAAARLADVIDEMVKALGKDASINLVAHSMGGLVSRSYLESGSYKNRPGFSHVKRLITIGTPHRGSPMALAAALGMERRLFLNAQQVKQLANDPKFTALYQLLPPKDEPFAWNRDDAKRFETVDIYEEALAQKLALVPDSLKSALTFHATLDLSRRPNDVRYFSFVGTREMTTSSVQIWRTGNTTGAKAVTKIDRDDAGDGTVPVWSATQFSIQMEPVSGEHGGLYKGRALQHVLGTLLGKPGVLAATGPTPEIWVQYKVLEPGKPTRVTIEFPPNTTDVKGDLRLYRRVDAQGNMPPVAPVLAQFPVTYKGPAIDHLAVLIAAPQITGIYEIEYWPEGAATRIAATELFVQEPTP